MLFMFSKMGGGIDGRGQGPLKAGNDKINYAAKAEKLFEGIVRNEKFIDEDGNLLTAGKSGKVPPGQIIGNQGNNGQSEPFRYFYHPDHLGSTSYITDATGEVYQHLEYFAFGETFVEEQGNTDKLPYKFNGKELDEETGLYYYGARYYDAKTSIFLSSDPLTEKAPGWTSYRAFFNNPIRFSDPDGRWEWDSNGNLVAQKGDQSYSLAKFLGTSQKNAMTILNRSGVTANDKGVLNLKEGQALAKKDLWVGFKSASGKVVNNSEEATSHYFKGNGESADVGDVSTVELLSSNDFQEKHNKITTQKVQANGNFAVDLTDETFHIGRTNVDYNVSNNRRSSSVKYTLFSRDGFWDPNFVAEKSLGRLFDRFTPDGKGPNLEAPGGTPYDYKTRVRTYFFKPVGDK